MTQNCYLCREVEVNRVYSTLEWRAQNTHCSQEALAASDFFHGIYHHGFIVLTVEPGPSLHAPNSYLSLLNSYLILLLSFIWSEVFLRSWFPCSLKAGDSWKDTQGWMTSGSDLACFHSTTPNFILAYVWVPCRAWMALNLQVSKIKCFVELRCAIV